MKHAEVMESILTELKVIEDRLEDWKEKIDDDEETDSYDHLIGTTAIGVLTVCIASIETACMVLEALTKYAKDIKEGGSTEPQDSSG